MPSSEATSIITPVADKSSPPPRTWFFGLFTRRVCLVPTWRCWALLLLTTGLVAVVGGRRLCDFLSMQDSVPGGVLVVEGWMPAYMGG